MAKETKPKKAGRQWKRIKSGFKNSKRRVERCAKCGLRIRGKDHEKGGHHRRLEGFRKGATGR